MSHETSHGHQSERAVSKVSFVSSFWLVVIIAGLFVAALNFIQAFSSGHEEGGHATHEMHSTGGHEGTHEATHEGATEAAGHEAAHEEKATEAQPEHGTAAPKEEAKHEATAPAEHH
jgi:hypothetical protein